MERITERLSYGYKFRKFENGTADEAVYRPDYDDSDWQEVRVPHDFAADAPFSIDNDSSLNRVSADGIGERIPHTGRTGGLPIVGLGVYRRLITVPESSRGRRITLEFDGVMWACEVYVNGKHVHSNHFGYNSFEVDITDAVSYGTPTLIAVGARVLPDCSRWYPGAGIYRNVRLVTKNPSHIRFHGVFLRQLEAACGQAAFEVQVDYEGPETLSFRAEIFDPDGNRAAELTHGTADGALSGIVTIPDVRLWDVDAPELYTAEITLLDENGQAADAVSERFGVRNIRFTADEGFFLNGRHLPIRGVCRHQDLGSLGAAVYPAGIRRHLRLLREMGVNAVRTSHNPPSPELLSLCDELGFLVMDEFFDEWQQPKDIANGYARSFREHAAQDVQDVIVRDRNHPSVILWSIGNEITEQWNPEGWRTAKMLADVCRRTDPTRLVTAGFNGPAEAFQNHLADFVDVVGLNYHHTDYAAFHRAHPDKPLLASETASAVSTRGVYHLPAELSVPAVKHDDLTVSAYELDAAGWGCCMETEFAALDDCPFVAGEFVWTGIDYLGEPTPYYTEWPSRSSYFGAIDLAGLPKNRFYGYKAHWTDADVLHVFPHWNWPGCEGISVPVHVYTSFPEAELFVNGRSMGRRRTVSGSAGDIERYRLVWKDVLYEPGSIRVRAYRADGSVGAERIIRTAGAPDHIMLTADRLSIASDGEDLVYCTATVVDADGNVCPLADNRLTFSVTGAGELLTTDNGDPRETEAFVRPDKKCLAGHCVACVRSVSGQTGNVTVRVSGDGIGSASFTVLAE